MSTLYHLPQRSPRRMFLYTSHILPSPQTIIPVMFTCTAMKAMYGSSLFFCLAFNSNIQSSPQMFSPRMLSAHWRFFQHSLPLFSPPKTHLQPFTMALHRRFSEILLARSWEHISSSPARISDIPHFFQSGPSTF
jgi:hypothetical protein